MDITEWIVLQYIRARWGATVLDTKWFHFASGIFTALLAALVVAPWYTIVDPQTAAKIIFGVGVVKAFLAALSEKQHSSQSSDEAKKGKEK